MKYGSPIYMAKRRLQPGETPGSLDDFPRHLHKTLGVVLIEAARGGWPDDSAPSVSEVRERRLSFKEDLANRGAKA